VPRRSPYFRCVICVDVLRVGVTQPDKVLFDDLSLTVQSGDRLAIVGVNGSGKSTLMRLLAGTQSPDRGDVRFGRGVRIALLDQDPQLPPGSVADYLGDSWEVAAVATSLGVSPLVDRATNELSGGQSKRVALAKTLVGEFDLILLDEPTNHLDLRAIEWLEQRLAASGAALVVITHDRHLMDRLTTARGDGRVVEIERGRAYVHRAAAGVSAYATYLEGRTARHAQAAHAESTRRILARRELEWLRRGAPARSTKPKARLRSAHDIVAGGPEAAGVRSADLLLDVGTTRLGNQVVELVAVSQSYADQPVLRAVDLLIEPGARLGVVGPNGSGKSTLLDVIASRREPSAGSVRRGSTVVTGYADQHTTMLDPDAIVREIVAGPLRQPDWHDRALLERFWFDSTAQFAPVRMLSGGERRRLQLVMVLATKPNLLVLDEPTNDLDLDTLRAFESFLDEWPGALVVASHDRTFLDRVVDHVLAIEPDGTVRRVAGGVQGWLENRAPMASTSLERSAATVKAKTSPPKQSRYTIGRQLREIEQAMATAQRTIDRLSAELANAADHLTLAAVGVELATAQAELGQLEDRWLQLSEQ
jgi:ATP-binding cassette subfamily F protein uup